MAESYVERYWRERREAEEAEKAMKKAVEHMTEEEVNNAAGKSKGSKRRNTQKAKAGSSSR